MGTKRQENLGVSVLWLSLLSRVDTFDESYECMNHMYNGLTNKFFEMERPIPQNNQER